MQQCVLMDIYSKYFELNILKCAKYFIFFLSKLTCTPPRLYNPQSVAKLFQRDQEQFSDLEDVVL